MHLHEVFGRLAARGHRVTLVASGWPGAAPRVEIDGMDVHRVGGRYGYAAAAPVYYRRTLRHAQVDVVVEDLNKVPLYSPLWSRSPVVLVVHHLFGATAFDEAALPLATATWLMERPLARLYRGVAVEAVSPSTAGDLEARGFDPGRIEVIPNGVDVSVFTPDPSVARAEFPTLVYVGRLKRYKGVDLILRAVALLRDRGEMVRFLVAGRGDYEEPLRALVAELRLEDRVEFLGFVTEARKVELFRSAWLHVLVSAKEGWGLTNLEAGACATPTVAADVPGLRDSVRHGESGLLVPHGDVEALASALAGLLGDPEARARLGDGARRFAEAHSWDRAADRTEAHLEDVSRAAA